MKKFGALLLIVCMALTFASCTVNDTPTGANQPKGYAFANEDFGEDLYVIGMRKGDDALTAKLNATLEELKADGKAAEISTKWFGSDIVVKDVPEAPEEEPSDDSWSYIENKGTLIVGLDDTFAPMGFRDEKNELVGFDIDLANALGEKLGVKVEFQPIDWNAKEMELNNKKIDLIWNGMSATPARRETMNLSNPYLNNTIVIMTMEGSDIKTKNDLKGKNVGTQDDSSALEVIEKDSIYSDIKDELKTYASYDEAIMDLEAGRIDAIIIDKVLGSYKASKK